MSTVRKKKRWRVDAECPLCRVDFIAERFTEPKIDKVASICRPCRNEIAESQHRLAKRTRKVWIRCLDRLPERIGAHVASVA